MTLKERFIDAVDILNKRAYSLVDQNAKGWAKIAYKNGLISLEECSDIEFLVDTRNYMSHGGMDRAIITEHDLARANRYIEIMTTGKQDESEEEDEEKPIPSPKKESAPPKPSTKSPDMTIKGISTKNTSVKLNNGVIDLKNVKATCCDWGDEAHWPALEILLRTNKLVTITYDDESTDLDGESPEDYCQDYQLFYEENGEAYYDYLNATRKMLQNDIRRIFDKCDKTSIFLDGLVVNTANMSEIKIVEDCITIRLYDGTILETQYTKNSSDHKGRDIEYYVKNGAFTVKIGAKSETEYSFAIDSMLKADFKYAEDTFIKTKSKRR